MTNRIKQLREELRQLDHAIVTATCWGAATTARMERRKALLAELVAEAKKDEARG